ncbi:hypothetical protein BP5796_06664 [Coleophoma crateriformis]|uniref:Uncharacterized protein n=1 Tax=Coleophoma crateriformis TaxID=565419 RepID=A0A3D8RP64_9HELO|nr:hypothetical protein BP5796_06664 [Coleophoma crateriformis]
MKSFTSIAAVSALAGAASAQTFTGYGVGPVSATFQNQTLFADSNAHPNVTNSVSITAQTSPTENWSWGINVTDISVAAEHAINTVISLTWPQQSTANSVCVVAINGDPLTYTTNPGSDGSCTTVLSGCIDDLTTALSSSLVSADGTAQCGTAVSNVTVPSSCSSYLTSKTANISASPMSNLQSGTAWLYSTNYGSSPSLNDSATRVWPLFLMQSSGSNVTSLASPVCLQAQAKASTTASSTASAATATSTKKSGAKKFRVGKEFVLATVACAMMAVSF